MKTDQEIDESAKLSATWFTNKCGSIEEQQIEFHSHKQGFIDGYKSCQRDADEKFNAWKYISEQRELEIQSLKSQLSEKDAEIELSEARRLRIIELASREQKLVSLVKDFQEFVYRNAMMTNKGPELFKRATETLKELGV